jgi:UDP-GlcNAc:undecaprenyl-phosphate/decaprenyl-phosphate GlcNAc-1-phosphate transferase
MTVNAHHLSLVVVFGALGLVVALGVIPFILARVAHLTTGRRDMHHQAHKTPVPRLGGIALAAAFVLVTLASYIVEGWRPGGVRVVIGITSLAMFGLGLWDDFRGLGARKKLLGQLLVAIAAFYFGLKVETLKNPFSGVIYDLGLWSLPATVLWLVALTNLINLVDGIDGLAGGICLMLMGLLAYVSFHGETFVLCISIGLAGALIGFLKFNFPPAKIYLGDGGAYFLGYLIAALTIQNSNKGTIVAALIAPVLALGLPIIDVTFSILRRGLKGLPIFRADRRHIHHRLLQAGYSRQRAVLILYAISLVFLCCALFAFSSAGQLMPVVLGLVFVICLLIAPSLGLIRNWLAIGTTVGNSLEMRKEVQYTLLLRKWLELEAGRSESVQELWTDLQFVARKVGFCELTLASATPGAPSGAAQMLMNFGRRAMKSTWIARPSRSISLPRKTE